MIASRNIQHRRRWFRSRGFTLIELMIALIMGVIVALAAVALSRAATTTFYEQARISNVEANVRTASERFRNDLSRVAYMSTGNIQLDTKVARIPGKTNPYAVGLTNLRGIAILKGPVADRDMSVGNSLAPHDVYIAGNLTSDDRYRGTWIQTANSSDCGGNAAQIRLNAAADPAVRRLFSGKTDPAEVLKMAQLVFLPGLRMNPSVGKKKYAVQVMDQRGCYHYTNVCSATATGSGTELNVTLDLETEPKSDASAPDGLLTPQDTLGDVCGASVMEEVALAPVHRVRWYIGPEKDASRNDPDPDMDGPLDKTKKYNLYRQLLTSETSAAQKDDDPYGASPVGPPEVIAEYAVDLRLGIIVDATKDGVVATTNIDMDAKTIEADLLKWAPMPLDEKLVAVKEEGPQRIRSVRYRMAFRTAFPDRSADLPLGAGPGYLARYKLDTNKYARVRTVMSEVALFNQAKAVY